MKRKFVQDHAILVTQCGSKLYGTDTPSSDEDKVGIYVPPKEFFIGFKSFPSDEINQNIVSKRADSKNNKDAVDFKLYDIRKFIRLAIQNNPNIIELLFVNYSSIDFCSKEGSLLLENADLFPTMEIVSRFLGYAKSQKSKMIVKSTNMQDLFKLKTFLEKIINAPKHQIFLMDYEEDLKKLFDDNLKIDKRFYNVGDLNVQRNITVKNAYDLVRERVSKFSSRYDDYISKYGFDTKFASHLIRLLLEAKELLETGKLVFPLKDASFLKDIKLGKYNIKEIIDYSNELILEIKRLEEKQPLPKKPDIKKIEKLQMEIIETHLGVW